MQLFSRSLTRRSLRRYVICLCFLSGMPVAPAFGWVMQGETADSQSRSIGEYRSDLKTFMKLSKEDDPQWERNAVYNLCRLHMELVTDPRFETSLQLQGMRAVIAKRLETFSKDEHKSKLRRDRKVEHFRRGSSKDDLPADVDANQTVETNSNGPEVLRSTGNRDGDVNNGSGASESASDTTSAMYASTLELQYSVGELTGGPGQLFNYAGGRLGPPWDHGQDLVDLITSVIDPAFWKRNGGPGSIQYYEPSLVLVVRATQQSNEEVGRLLERLRSNGGTQLNIGGAGTAIGN